MNRVSKESAIRRIRYYCRRALFSALSCTLVVIGAQQTLAQDTDPLLLALSGHEMTASVAQLTALAGGEDALVQRLLELRRSEKPPFAGVRAAKLLLAHFSDRPEVQAALVDDVRSDGYTGLARLMAANLETAKSSGARRALAIEVLSRSKRDAQFAPYAKELRKSADPEVARLARESLAD